MFRVGKEPVSFVDHCAMVSCEQFTSVQVCKVWKGFWNDKVSTGQGVREGPSRSQNGSRVGAVITYVRTHVDTLLRAEAAPVGSEQLGHRGGSEVLGVGLLRRLEDHTRLIQHIRVAAEDAELSLSLCSLLIGRCAAVHLRRERLDLGKHFEDPNASAKPTRKDRCPCFREPSGLLLARQSDTTRTEQIKCHSLGPSAAVFVCSAHFNLKAVLL